MTIIESSTTIHFCWAPGFFCSISITGRGSDTRVCFLRQPPRLHRSLLNLEKVIILFVIASKLRRPMLMASLSHPNSALRNAATKPSKQFYGAPPSPLSATICIFHASCIMFSLPSDNSEVALEWGPSGLREKVIRSTILLKIQTLPPSGLLFCCPTTTCVVEVSSPSLPPSSCEMHRKIASGVWVSRSQV